MVNSIQVCSSGSPWNAAHTKPRCEKKFHHWCEVEGLECELPTYTSLRKYRGKEVTFYKPLFPGYVFLRVPPMNGHKVYASGYVANLLKPPDQEEFESQLASVLLALETMAEIRLVPNIGPGTRVLIRNGPLAGIEGWVENREGPSEVLLRLDFIGQAAAVRVTAEDLEVI